MFEFKTDVLGLENELFELVRQFESILEKQNNELKNFQVTKVNHSLKIENSFANFININGNEYYFENDINYAYNQLLYRREMSRSCKLSLYKALASYFKRSLPWGALIGVHPTKLAYELKREGISSDSIANELEKIYLVSKEKSHLIEKILINQSGVICSEENKVNLYIHVPLCPSRCKYCSFVSSAIDKQLKFVEPYVNALVEEVEVTKKFIESNNLVIDSIYLGGGTPTILSDNQFERLLKAIDCNGQEFTCEAGRPDTITISKLDLMKKYKVTRISINPQSLNDETLKINERNHSADDFFNAFNLAGAYNFSVNVDLIAGLEGDDLEIFKNTLNKIIALNPENITVHTLSRKNGSLLKLEELSSKNIITEDDIEKMMDYAHFTLQSNNYLPYYLYRQKLMLGNLENAGYCKEGRACKNNVTTMEESLSVIACGAGGISKRIFKSCKINCDKIERSANLKDIKLYLEQFDERLKRKLDFFS